MSGNDDLYRTPAGRLALVLRAIKAQAGKSSQNNVKQNKHVIAEHLGIDERDSAGYFAAVAEIMSMPVAIRRDVAALENPAAPSTLLLQHMPRVEASLPMLGTPTGNVKQLWDRLGDDIVVGLEFTSHILAQGRSHEAFDQGKLDAIRSMATEIIDELAGEDGFPVRFREEIRRHAQGIVDAVNGYKIHGADALLDEADALVGVLVRNPTDSREHPILKKVVALAGSVVLAVGVYTAPHQIADATSAYGHILELPSSIETPGGDVIDAEIVT